MLTEVMVSSFLLMLIVLNSTRLFTDSMGALGKSIRVDQIGALIHADIEQERGRLAQWSVDPDVDQAYYLAYIPDEQLCESKTIGDAIISDLYPDHTDKVVSAKHDVTRSVTTDGTLIILHYTIAGRTGRSVTILPPASQWCP